METKEHIKNLSIKYGQNEKEVLNLFENLKSRRG